jgi:Domain of unknown function (DUF4062)
MAVNRKVVKVFLASPGDLSDERKTAKSVVDEFNAVWADELSYQVELVGWEDTVSVFGRPQATINRELEYCELFVGLMWKKWGTPPDTVGKYTSGFEEEFRISVDRRSKEDRPEISLLFKEIEPEFLLDPGDELKRVLTFRDQLIAEKTILFEQFSGIREFETKFRRCITTYVNRFRHRETEKVLALSQSSQSYSEQQRSTEENNNASETPLSMEGAKFLRGFISKTERDPEKEPILPVEVARFRLLANILEHQGNDGGSIGVHDSNLLYAEGGNFAFGYSELRGLVSSGCEHYSHQNAPLWRWFKSIDGFTKEILPIHSVFDSSIDGKAGALAAMQLISEPLSSDNQNDRKFYLDRWFAKETADAVKVAALSYLADFGIVSDLPFLIQELQSGNYQTSTIAADAIIRINLRDSRDKAISSLYELQPSSVSSRVLKKLFENDASITTKTLLDGINHRNFTVRRTVVELLCKRQSLPAETGEQLLDDSDAKIRFEALNCLTENGRVFSDDEAKKILVKEEPKGLYGLSISARSSDEEERLWHMLRLKRLQSLDNKDLEFAVAESFISDIDANFVLIERQFHDRREELRRSLDDQYKEEFFRRLDHFAKRLGIVADSVLDHFRTFENFFRSMSCRIGLDLLCRNGDQTDLGRVRLVMKSGFVDYSDADMEFLKRFGEWDDINLIVEAVKRPTASSTHSAPVVSNELKYRLAAQAIYSIGKARLAQCLVQLASTKVLEPFVIEIPYKAFSSLSDTTINQLLRSPDEPVRKIAAVKCVRAMPKKRLTKLLDEYVSSSQSYYYNVVHWLDFGLSVPRNCALPAADKILSDDHIGS